MAFMVPIQYTAKLGEQNNTLVEFMFIKASINQSQIQDSSFTPTRQAAKPGQLGRFKKLIIAVVKQVTFFSNTK